MLRWLPQRGVRSGQYLPPEVEVPDGQPYEVVFDMPATGPLATAEHSESLREEFLATHVKANRAAVVGAVGTFLMQIYHKHGNEQRQLYSKPLPMETAAGTGQRPTLLPSPLLLAAGDTLTVEVRNLTNNGAAPPVYLVADIQVVIAGVHPQ